MSGNFKGFVSLSNIVSEVLYGIFDHEEKKHYGLVLQKVLNSLRNINVHYSKSYKEVEVTLDEDLHTGAYPTDLVKMISVGNYVHGEFWSFTRKPNMARTITGAGETYDDDFNEDEMIPKKGMRFGAEGRNIVGYWVEDDENRRFFVRNYTGTKVILRYRSNGIDCTMETCIPYTVKDLLVSMVIYDLALMGIPRKFSGMELQLKQQERSRHFDEYTDLEYIPGNMDEFLDSQFASFNVTAGRG